MQTCVQHALSVPAQCSHSAVQCIAFTICSNFSISSIWSTVRWRGGRQGGRDSPTALLRPVSTGKVGATRGAPLNFCVSPWVYTVCSCRVATEWQCRPALLHRVSKSRRCAHDASQLIETLTHAAPCESSKHIWSPRDLQELTCDEQTAKPLQATLRALLGTQRPFDNTSQPRAVPQQSSRLVGPRT